MSWYSNSNSNLKKTRKALKVKQETKEQRWQRGRNTDSLDSVSLIAAIRRSRPLQARNLNIDHRAVELDSKARRVPKQSRSRYQMLFGTHIQCCFSFENRTLFILVYISVLPVAVCTNNTIIQHPNNHSTNMIVWK